MPRLAISLLLGLFLCASVSGAAPRRVMMMPVKGGAGLSDAGLHVFGEALLAELRRRIDLAVTTMDDVRAVLSHEQQQQLLGCDDERCLSDLGGALGSEELVTASLGQLGKSWVLVVRRLDASSAKVVREVNRRLTSAKVDPVLDLLPAVVTELFDRSDDAARPVSAPAPVAVDCAKACGHVLSCKGNYVDGDLDALTGKDECLEMCGARVAIGEDPDSPRKRGRREAAWSCATAATDCLDLDKRCDVY